MKSGRVTGMMLAGSAAALLALGLGGWTVAAAQPAAGMEMPRLTDSGALEFPAGYREWQFVTAGHGMNYNENGGEGIALPFDNVFVQRDAYAAFKETGHWPDGTMLVLEIRGGTQTGSINKHGSFQIGGPLAVEVHVHDKRLAGGWGFFTFSGVSEASGASPPGPAPVIAHAAPCYSCHEAHAAVDTTFVQFYPTLLPIATAKGTLSEAYRKEEAGK